MIKLAVHELIQLSDNLTKGEEEVFILVEKYCTVFTRKNLRET